MQFRTCIGTLNFKLDESELKAIIDKYTESSGLINYAAFCANIDSIFQDEGPDYSKSSAIFSPEEKQILSNLLNSMRIEIKNKRILIKPQL